jgi:hypothetical protein
VKTYIADLHNRKGKMAKTKTNKPDRGTGGSLAVRTFGGLNADNFTAGVGLGDRLKFEKKGKSYPVQFVADPGDGTQFIEFWQHQFRDGQGWKYVPCLEADCPLCKDEDEEVRKRRYRFVTNLYSMRDKKIVILEGPKDLSSRIFRRWESAHKAAESKKKGKAKPFTERIYGLTQNDTQPVTYDVEELTDEDSKKLNPKEFHDLQKYIDSAVQRFYQGKPVASKKSNKKKGKSALDADPTQEDSYTEEQLKGLSAKKLAKAAKSFNIDPEGVAPEKLVKKILKAQK